MNNKSKIIKRVKSFKDLVLDEELIKYGLSNSIYLCYENNDPIECMYTDNIDAICEVEELLTIKGVKEVVIYDFKDMIRIMSIKRLAEDEYVLINHLINGDINISRRIAHIEKHLCGISCHLSCSYGDNETAEALDRVCTDIMDLLYNNIK